MKSFSSRARLCLASLSILVAAASFAQPALSNDPMLRQFLQAMPKGGDLHNHLSGSVYAESYLGYAASDGLCVDSSKLTITQCPTEQQIMADSPAPAIVPASSLFAPYS